MNEIRKGPLLNLDILLYHSDLTVALGYTQDMFYDQQKMHIPSAPNTL